MIKHLLTLAIAISIYDISHDPENVLVEACNEESQECVLTVVPRVALDDPEAMEELVNFLESHL